MPFKEVAPPKVADAVVSQVEELIAHCVLRPGDALPPERALAEDLGVSRASLREALDILVRRGVLERRRSAGLRVAEKLDAALADPLEALIGARPEALDDFFSFRRMLEAEAAGLAAKRAVEADLERLGAIAEHMRAAHREDDVSRGHRLDFELHIAIAEASGNLVTAHVARALGRVLRRAIRETRQIIHARPGVSAAILEQHLALIDAIRNRDPIAAAAASDAHLDFVASELEAGRAAAQLSARASLRPDRINESGSE